MSLKTKYRTISPEIRQLALENKHNPEAILDIFQVLQRKHGGLTRDNIEDTARALGIPAARAYGVASFYSMIMMPPHDGGIIRVCDGPVCWLQHATKTRAAVDAAIEKLNGNGRWLVKRNSCLGLCDHAPAALVNDIQTGPLDAQNATDILNGKVGLEKDYVNPHPGELRVMLAKVGKVNPDSIESAISMGAYAGLQKALLTPPENALQIVEASGLTGRGGAGFPVGRKWRFVAQAENKPKYIICNADESEPLIFKDRVLINTNPHQILEGMIIAGYVTGASEGYIYIRGEYQSLADRLENAIQQAEAINLLGERIFNSDFSFKIHVHRGAGAYICGEETALIESIEGTRGEPRYRPPYPPSYGLRGLPTLVNNVESYAAVPAILEHGSDWYRSLSSYSTPGTKLYMVLGHVKNPGLFEAPFGITLRQVIEKFGGGMRDGSEFQFALTGGAAGTIVSTPEMDTPIDYASASKGISLGAGAFLVCDQTVSPVAFLREIVHFFAVESCGKCTPCRIGTHQSLEILDRLSDDQGKIGDIENLITLADVMQVASFCGLGQSVAIPVRSALKHFSPEFHAAITKE